MKHPIGNLYAFEKFVDNYIQGNYYKLRLRKGDEFPELEDLAEKIAKELKAVEEINSLPILPEGAAKDQSTAGKQIS